MRVHGCLFAFLAMSKFIFAESLPVGGLDLPKELIMDVNKAYAIALYLKANVFIQMQALVSCRPYPVVNIIAEKPLETLGTPTVLAVTQEARQAHAEKGIERISAENHAADMQAAALKSMRQRADTLHSLAYKTLQ